MYHGNQEKEGNATNRVLSGLVRSSVKAVEKENAKRLTNIKHSNRRRYDVLVFYVTVYVDIFFHELRGSTRFASAVELMEGDKERIMRFLMKQKFPFPHISHLRFGIWLIQNLPCDYKTFSRAFLEVSARKPFRKMFHYMYG